MYSTVLEYDNNYILLHKYYLICTVQVHDLSQYLHHSAQASMVGKQLYTHVYVYVHECNHTWYNYVSVISITRHSLACVIHLIISIIRFEGENAMCIVSLS